MIEKYENNFFKTEEKQSSAKVKKDLENEEESQKQNYDYDGITDLRLKKFYEHLDIVNKKSLSPFQHFQRLKLHQEENNKSHIVNTIDYKIKNKVHSKVCYLHQLHYLVSNNRLLSIMDSG